MNKEMIEQAKNLIAAHSCCQEAKDRMNLYQKPRLCTSIWYTTA